MGDSRLRQFVFSYTVVSPCNTGDTQRLVKFLRGDTAYQENPNARYKSMDIVYVGESFHLTAAAPSNQVTEICQSLEESADGLMVVGFAIVRWKPPTSSRCQQGTIGPSISMD